MLVKAGCLQHARLERAYNDWPSPALPHDPTIALCSTEKEVLHLARSSDLKVDALIALTPQAACQCLLLDLAYYKIEDFFDVSAFLEADEPMLSFQRSWSDRVDAFAWEIVPDFAKYGFLPAGHYFFWLKVVIDMIYRAAFGLAHLIVAAKPREVIYFQEESPDVTDDLLFFKESVYSLILPNMASEYGVRLTELPVPGDVFESESNRLSASLRTLISPPQRHSGLRRLLKRVLPETAVQALQRMKPDALRRTLSERPRRGMPRIVFSAGWDVSLMVDLARSRGWTAETVEEVIAASGPNHSEIGDIIAKADHLWPQLKAQPFFSQPFHWVGVDLGSVAESRLLHWWKKIVPNMWGTLLKVREYFRVHPPRALLFVTPWSAEHYGLLQAARSLEIPIVTHQHGTFDGPNEYTTLDMTDLRYSDYRFVYGDGNAKYFQSRTEHSANGQAQPIVVGSCYYDELQRAPSRRDIIRDQLGVASTEHLILYIPTSYQYNWYVARQAYLGVPYFQLLAEVVNLFARHPHLKYVYKPFPETPPDPVERVIASRLPNCHIVRDVSVPELLDSCDAAIIDIPSTALAQAMLTSKPILVFSDSRCISLRPEAKALLKKRVTLTETSEDFLKELGSFLDQNEFPEIVAPDRSYLRAYGTFLDDGRSAERALEALTAVINRS